MQKASKEKRSPREFRKTQFARALLNWYDSNRRDLPWRRSPELYKTVVSEFMLQQTRVSTVVPYFERWMRRFPDFHSLASASIEEVLKEWEGLGYYSRARNLHLLSQKAKEWKSPPVGLDGWKELPGVGPYVAAAVTSIALNQPHAVCDGNVVRVVSRLFSISETFKSGAAAQRAILPLAQQLLSKKRPGDYNQAIMDLGATTCLVANPLCQRCPVAEFCASSDSEAPLDIPRFSPAPVRNAKIKRYWIEQDNRLLLLAGNGGRLRGIHELPSELPGRAEERFSKLETLAIRERTIGKVRYAEKIVRPRGLPSLPRALPQGYVWMNWKELDAFILSAPHRKWICEIRNSTISPEVK